MLASFNGTWDWTAIGTLTLAVVTVAAVLVGALSLRQTQKAIALSRKEVEEAHRPVVVPTADQRTMSTGHARNRVDRLAYPQVLLPKTFLFPVENVGAGPALNVEATVAWTNQDGASMNGRAAIASLGQDRLVPLPVYNVVWDGRSDIEFTITYQDVGDKGWVTAGRWVAEGGRYEAVSIKSIGGPDEVLGYETYGGSYASEQSTYAN